MIGGRREVASAARRPGRCRSPRRRAGPAGLSRSASLYATTASMPSVRHARRIRSAISPRLAIRTRATTWSALPRTPGESLSAPSAPVRPVDPVDPPSVESRSRRATASSTAQSSSPYSTASPVSPANTSTSTPSMGDDHLLGDAQQVDHGDPVAGADRVRRSRWRRPRRCRPRATSRFGARGGRRPPPESRHGNPVETPKHGRGRGRRAAGRAIRARRDPARVPIDARCGGRASTACGCRPLQADPPRALADLELAQFARPFSFWTSAGTRDVAKGARGPRGRPVARRVSGRSDGFGSGIG